MILIDGERCFNFYEFKLGFRIGTVKKLSSRIGADRGLPFLLNHLTFVIQLKSMSAESVFILPQPVRSFVVDQLPVQIYAKQSHLATAAASIVNDYLCRVIEKQGSAAVILATGNSQIQFLQELVDLRGVDWSRVTLFHMDEYLGITADHSASFQNYMRKRVEQLVSPRFFHYLDGDCLLPFDECQRYSNLLKAQPIDLCCLGVGENGHLAFNDPPVAQIDDPHWVKLVKLDDACKMQQVKEGHFPNLQTVPPYAFTLTLPALCSAKKMICLSPEKRKAIAIRSALQGPITSACPASVLRQNPQALLMLDTDSAELLT